MIPIHRTRQPCMICGKKDWCMVSEDGSVVLCARVMNATGRRTRAGYYVHKLDDSAERQPIRPTKTKPAPEPVTRDWMVYVEQSIRNVDGRELAFFAESLGLSVDSLRRLSVGRVGRLWTFPMRDGTNRIIGIRTRDGVGQKRAITGSRNGLFIPIALDNREPLIICEGPTDTAAILDCGLNAVGRASCTTGGDMLSVLCQGKAVAIVSDRDRAGYDGANRIANQIRRAVRSVRVIVPPAKDVRQWRPRQSELLEMVKYA